MLSTKIIIPTILTLLISVVHSQPVLLRRATYDQVNAANSNLVSQVDTADAPIVAIFADTPTATKQQVPSILQTANLAIVSAQNSLTPTAATSDPNTEATLARGFGQLSNAVEELGADLYQKKQYLATVPNLQGDTKNQIQYLDNNFRAYTTFMLGLVTEQSWKNTIQYSSNNATYTVDQALNAYT